MEILLEMFGDPDALHDVVFLFKELTGLEGQPLWSSPWFSNS